MISPPKLKIVYFGTGKLGLPTLRKLIEIGSKPLLVITAPDRPAGRGLKLTPSPIKELAIKYGIEVIQPEDINSEEVKSTIRKKGADIGLLIAYGQKLAPELIDMFPYGIINLHASLLPKYRGAAPINWAIINGEEKTGLTVIQLDEKIDAGLILNQIEVEIKPLERADELEERLAKLGVEITIKTLLEIEEGRCKPREQDPSLVSYAPKLKKELSRIDWREPAKAIANKIRGLWPWPAVKAVYIPKTEGAKVIELSLARARPIIEDTHPETIQPGTVLDDFTIKTIDGRLEILEVKPAGRRLMSWQDFIHGRNLQAGDRLI